MIVVQPNMPLMKVQALAVMIAVYMSMISKLIKS